MDVNLVLIVILSILLIWMFFSWYLTKKKAARQLNAAITHAAERDDQLAALREQMARELEEKAVLATALYESKQQEKALKEALTQLTQEKVVFSTDLQEAWKIYTDLKAKYDALFLKNIEVTNERNRLRKQ